MAAVRVRAGAALLLAAALALGLPLPAGSSPAADGTPEAPEMITFPFLGGTITMNPDLEVGERFLQLVAPPVFTRTEEALSNPRLQPGDGGDQGPVVLERRVTDYSYMSEPWTGGMRIDRVHGSQDAYVCVCDAVFVMGNQEGLDPTRPIWVEASSHLWFDNLTIYSGGIVTVTTNRLIVSNSLFLDSGGLLSFNSSDGYVHNITAIMQRGPGNIVNSPPELLGGKDFWCFPHPLPACEGTGVQLIGGARWVIEWSHFAGSGAAGSDGGTRDLVIRHNTFRDTLPVWSFGSNEVSWNLIRGSSSFGPFSVDSEYTSFHNNSIIFPFKLEPSGYGVKGNAGLMLVACAYCEMRHNDFLGYGWPHPLFQSTEQCCPALYVFGEPPGSSVVANGNYWGTLHDPKEPEGLWVKLVNPQHITLELDEWEVQPIHDITPIMYTLDYRDVPWWLEQLTGLPTYQAWKDLGLP